MWILAQALLTAAADCPATSADLASALEVAEATYARLDVAGFRAATDTARAEIDCLADPLPRQLAARYHRFHGLRAFVDRDALGSTQAFAAARAIEPEYRFPETLVPEGHPVLDAYTAIDPTRGTYTPAPAPARGHLAFDGRDTLERPASWPTVFQRFDEVGAVDASAWLGPNEPLPAYPTKQGARRPLLVGAAGGFLLSGALLGGAALTRAEYMRTDEFERLGGLRRTTNTLWIAAVVGGAASAGTTAFALVGAE